MKLDYIISYCFRSISRGVSVGGSFTYNSIPVIKSVTPFGLPWYVMRITVLPEGDVRLVYYYHLLLDCTSFSLPPYAGVMGCGAAEATGLGFVCFVVLNLRVLSANRVDFGLFCFINLQWDAVLQKLAWALFVLLLSTFVCCQPTELIWAFLFHKFSISGFCSPCCIFHTYEQMILCVFDCISLLLFMIFYILPPPVNFAAPP